MIDDDVIVPNYDVTEDKNDTQVLTYILKLYLITSENFSNHNFCNFRKKQFYKL